MSHTVLGELPCNEGRGAALVALLKEALVETRAFDGLELVEVYTDQDNPDLVVLWEKWATRDHHAAYLAWRMETGFLEGLAQFMDPSKIRLVHFDAHPDI